jgi:hypothetical protein
VKYFVILGFSLVVAAGPALGAVKPDAIASSGGNGVASVSGGPWDGWRVVVTTHPAGLPVRLQIGGRRKVIAKGPIVRRATCNPRCAVKVTAQLWPPDGKTPPKGSLSLALYGT